MIKKIRKAWFNVLYNIKYGTKVKSHKSADNIYFVFGPGRSGTSWLIDLLSQQTNTPMRTLSEGLYRFRPKIPLNPTADHTGTPFLKEITEEHPLIKAYQAFANPAIMKKDLLPKDIHFRFLRDDPNFSIFIMKEVHSLLASGSLIDTLNAKAIIILRNPYRVIDSLFHANGINNNFLQGEEFLFFNNALNYGSTLLNIEELQHFLNTTADNQLQSIYTKFSLLLLVSEYLFNLTKTNDNAYLLMYENLLINTHDEMKKAYQFLDLEFDETVRQYITSLKNKESFDDGHFETKKNPTMLKDKPLQFLTQEHITAIQSELLPYFKNFSCISLFDQTQIQKVKQA